MSEATKARVQAERDLEHRKAEGRRVRVMLDEWQRIRERNNIAAAFEASIRGRRA